VKVLSLGLVFLAGLFCLSNALVPARSMTLDTQASAKAALLALHQAARRAHLNRDVDFIVAGMGTEFTTVHEGKVKVMSHNDVRKQFTEYFRGAEFSAWDDLESPIIQVSPDGRMGWMIVRVRIAYTNTDAGGAKTKEDTVMAWISVYEKRDGKWLLIANVSTSEP